MTSEAHIHHPNYVKIWAILVVAADRERAGLHVRHPFGGSHRCLWGCSGQGLLGGEELHARQC